jgi:tetratricopeptide (TPR) repeat protein
MKPSYAQTALMRRAVRALSGIAASLEERESSGRETWISRITKLLPWQPNTFRMFVFDLVIGGLLLIFVGAAVKTALKHGTVIEPFSVPPGLASRGYTGTVVAHQLIDDVYTVVDSARTTLVTGYRSHKSHTTDLIPSVASDLTIPQIEVPGTGISMTAIVYYVRDLFGIYDTKITGEVVEENLNGGGNKSNEPPMYSLHIRSSEQDFYYRSPKPDKSLENVLEAAALPLLEKLNPYVAGVVYWRKADYSKAAAMAQQCLSSDSKVDQQWGMNLRSAISMGRQRFKEAQANLAEAHEQYPNFPPLDYNIGAVDYEQKHYLKAFVASLDGVTVDNNPTRQSTGYVHAGQALDVLRTNKIPFRSNAHLSQVLDELFGHIVGSVSLDESEVGPLSSDQNPMSGADELGLEDGVIPSKRAVLTMFRRAMRADPTQPEAFYYSGMIENETGDKPDAEEHMELAISLFSDRDSAVKRSTAHDVLGVLYADEMKFDAAFAEFKLASELIDKPIMPMFHWAQALALRADHESAESKLAQSDRSDAATKLELAISMAPNDNKLRINAAETFQRLGMNDRAKELWNK